MWKFFLFFHYFILHSSYQVPLLPQEKRYTRRPPPPLPRLAAALPAPAPDIRWACLASGCAAWLLAPSTSD